eukprot:gene25597-33423_t
MKKRLKRRMDKVIDQMTKEFNFSQADLDEVRLSCSLLHETNTDLIFRDTVRGSLRSTSHSVRVDAARDGSRPFNMSVDQRESFSKSLAQITEHLSRTPSHGSETGQTINRSRRASRSGGYEDRPVMEYEQFSRMMSLSNRGQHLIVIPQLLGYVRAIFLEILPRLSFSAQFLLYTIDVGIDNVNEEGGAPDWLCLASELGSSRPLISTLEYIEANLPHCFPKLVAGLVGKLEARWEKRSVYMLTSFIEAHTHAQKKIHSFTEGKVYVDDIASAQTPEEVQVIEESKNAEILSSMSDETLAAIRSKQAARLVLAKV